MDERRSPKVLSLAWGEIEIEGVGRVKDAALHPGGGGAWDWNVTGTRHSPGIQPADVEPLLAAGATSVVLSRGQQLVLQVMPETESYLAECGVDVHIAETREAVRVYNLLADAGVRVAALLHSTC
ncbi:Mth938-like domain-containing protein [Catellatospora citrea]|uniref:Mth938-like domain-containing protein n=1 Tax=Catellatospora citrea TaxID=53366 RepID=UPI001EF23252|nr:Mth938-like domain-containing protein [Catellatospora citrea]